MVTPKLLFHAARFGAVGNFKSARKTQKAARSAFFEHARSFKKILFIGTTGVFVTKTAVVFVSLT